SLGNAIGIREPPSEIYGKLMSIPDTLMWSYYELLTDVPSAEIAARRRAVESGSENPRDAKADLARRITAQFYGESSAVRTEEDFRRAFARGQEPETIETVEVSPEAGALGHVLVAAKLCASMREARRKIAEGAVAIFES